MTQNMGERELHRSRGARRERRQMGEWQPSLGDRFRPFRGPILCGLGVAFGLAALVAGIHEAPVIWQAMSDWSGTGSTICGAIAGGWATLILRLNANPGRNRGVGFNPRSVLVRVGLAAVAVAAVAAAVGIGSAVVGVGVPPVATASASFAAAFGLVTTVGGLALPSHPEWSRRAARGL